MCARREMADHDVLTEVPACAVWCDRGGVRGAVLCGWSNPARGGVMGRGNSGAPLRVCRVHRALGALRELWELLAGASWTYLQGEMLPGLRGAWGRG